MDAQPNTSVILHTYQQQPNLPEAYISAPLNDNNSFVGAGNSHFAANVWSNPTFSAATYPDAQFGGEISVLSYPEVSTAVYDDFSKDTTMSDPSLHGGSNSSSSTSEVGSSVDCNMSPEPVHMPSVKRGRPTENPCWSYFHRIDDQLVKCRLCTKVVRSACATNMTKHLERHHTEDFEKVSGQIKLCRMTEGSRGKLTYHENPLGSLPVIANQYLLPKMEVIEPFDSSQYYPIEDQVFSQFEHHPDSGIAQWPLTHFWQNGSMLSTGHIGEASTSAIGTSVIQTVNKTSDEGLQQAGQVATQKMSGGKPTKTVNGVEKPYMKRNRKTEHPVWEFFKRTSDGNAECTICQGVVKSPCSSNFMRHLMRHHSSEYNVVYLKWIQKRNITHPGVQYTSVPPPSHSQFLNEKSEQAIPSA